MLRRWVPLLGLAVLLLGGCGGKAAEPPVYEGEINSQTVRIEFDEGTRCAGTITAGHGNYVFCYEPDGTLSVTYPNRETYTCRETDGAIATALTYDGRELEEQGYFDLISLMWTLEDAMGGGRTDSGRGIPVPLSLLLAALGVWQLCTPKSAWWLSNGWLFKNAEPSELALTAYRIGGGLLLLIGVFSLLA